MGKSAPDATLDVFTAKIATATRMTLCSAEPANFAGIAAVLLASVVMTPGDGNDYAIADGDVSGRKVTTVEKLAVSITNSGTVTHVALDDGVNLIVVSTTDSQVVVALQLVTIPPVRMEIPDPA